MPGVLSRWLVLFVLTMQAVFRLSDVVINRFLAFFHIYFHVLGHNFPIGGDTAQNIPSSLYEARKVVKEIEFKRYVVCKKCLKLYCYSEGAGSKRSKHCGFCQFPSHPQYRMRAPCGQLLLKTVETYTGKKFLYPFLTYCYVGLEASLQALLSRPNFFSNCEQ